MLPFSSVNGVWFGCSKLLRVLHDEQMTRSHSSDTAAEREHFSEEASKTRQMMSWCDLIRTGASLDAASRR